MLARQQRRDWCKERYQCHQSFAVLGTTSARLGDRQVPATTAEYKLFLTFARAFGQVRLIGIERTNSYGAGLSQYLMTHNVEIREIIRLRRAALWPPPSRRSSEWTHTCIRDDIIWVSFVRMRNPLLSIPLCLLRDPHPQHQFVFHFSRNYDSVLQIGLCAQQRIQIDIE